MVVTLKINTRMEGHEQISRPHGRNILSNMRHQWSHTGHQKNYSHGIIERTTESIWWPLYDCSKNGFF